MHMVYGYVAGEHGAFEFGTAVGIQHPAATLFAGGRSRTVEVHSRQVFHHNSSMPVAAVEPIVYAISMNTDRLT